MEKVGVFLCTGCDIAKAINVDGFEDLSKGEGAKHFVSNPCLCSEEAASDIRKAVDDGTVDSVVIAACSPRCKVEEFRLDQTKATLFRVGLREQVAWSQKHGDEDTQMLAEDMLRMGIARSKKINLPTPVDEEIESRIMVVGGGASGLQAALGASAMGHPVTLVESADKLGGYMATIKQTVPERPPYDTLHENGVFELVSSVDDNSNIQVLKSAKIKKIKGQPGQFDVEVESSTGTEAFRVGAIVQATGARPYDAGKLKHLGYGVSKDVVTTVELDAMLASGQIHRPSDGRSPARILFVQCAGSRDEKHLPYCSTECCAATLRQVAAVHRDFPNVECAVVYRDMRTPGQLERFYLGVQESSGAMFARGEVERIEESGNGLKVLLKDSMLGEEASLDADLVVLAVGMVPNSADGEAIRSVIDAKAKIAKNESEVQVAEAKKIVEQLGHHEGTEILNLQYRQGPDLPTLRYGFPDSHYICFPYETRRTGIYAAGALHAPMGAAEALEDGWGAAMKASQCINAAMRGEAVHPRAGDIGIGDFFLQRCTQCKRCTEECPFGTLDEDEKGTPQYNKLRCRRCGICHGSCPERIISFPDYFVDAVSSMIKAIEVPEEDEEKPRMVAFLCENDALPALDEAAKRRLTWNPWFRIIPVRCLGAINIVWIADSLSRGIDGVLLIGCKKGDDYQCHYMRGSELAVTRMTNVKETLDRLTLESERVRIEELTRDEFHRIPEIFEEFASTIEEVGPNPYKGF